jgi:PAS domain S-box-containing protein
MTDSTDRMDAEGDEGSEPNGSDGRERSGPASASDDLLDAMADVLYVIDEEWTILQWNDRLCEVTGYTDDEIARMHPLEFIPEADREAVAQRVYAVFDRDAVEAMETGIVTKSGEVIPFEFNGAGITNEDGDVIAMVGTARSATTKARQRDLLSRVFETSPVGIAVLDGEGRIVRTNDRVEGIVGVSEAELVGRHYADAEWDAYDGGGEPLAPGEGVIGRAFAACETTKDDEYRFERPGMEPKWLSVSAAPILDTAGEPERIVVAIVDVTDRRERERELERKRRDLEHLDRINAIIRRMNRALVGAVTREEIERAVCERLTDGKAYAFAWIGDPYPTGGELDARTWAGRGAAHVEGISVTVGDEGSDGERTNDGPTGRAIRSREVETATASADESKVVPRDEAAIGSDVRSAVAVPLVYGDTLYGVLNLYSDRPEGFSEEERAVLGELGETIGYAIDATQSRRLLFTDRVIELELRSDSSASFFIDATKRVGGTISLDGVVPSAEESDLYYMTLRGASPKDVLDLAADAPGIEGRLVGETDEESRLEFRVSGASITRVLLGRNARVTTARAEEGEARIVAQIAPDADVRTVVEAVREPFPGSELVAKREIEREARTPSEFRETVEERLTERQATALEAAFHAGYFEWPRVSSAEEVAATMDIAPPTFHQHLRAAHRKMLEAFFEA